MVFFLILLHYKDSLDFNLSLDQRTSSVQYDPRRDGQRDQEFRRHPSFGVWEVGTLASCFPRVAITSRQDRNAKQEFKQRVRLQWFQGRPHSSQLWWALPWTKVLNADHHHQTCVNETSQRRRRPWLYKKEVPRKHDAVLQGCYGGAENHIDIFCSYCFSAWLLLDTLPR